MPFISSKKLFDIIGLLYESAQSQTAEGWSDVYLKMSEIFSAGPGGLSLYLPENDQFELIVSTINDDLISQYNEYRQNAIQISHKIRSGHFLRQALDSAELS